MMIESLICVQCGTDFQAERKRGTARMYCSRRCQTINWNNKHREDIHARNKDWRKRNPDKVLAANRAFARSAKCRDRRKAWLIANPKKHGEYNKKWNSTPNGKCYAALVSARRTQKYRESELTRRSMASRRRSRKVLLADANTAYECVECGSAGVFLECHHKDLNPLNSTRPNLEWWCLPCHHRFHAEVLRAEK